MMSEENIGCVWVLVTACLSTWIVVTLVFALNYLHAYFMHICKICMDGLPSFIH